jgi:endo-1,4-beta-xylanase
MEKHLNSVLGILIFITGLLVAVAEGREPFDPSKSLKEYAGNTIIGTKSNANSGDSVLKGEQAEAISRLHLQHCTGLQVQVYPAWQGSFPDEAPESIDKIVFDTKGLSALANWGIAHKQKTLHHVVVTCNQYHPEWFWENKYTSTELDHILKSYITALVTAAPEMDAWNITNELFVKPGNRGTYKKDGIGSQDCVWMRMGFEPDKSGLEGNAKVNNEHPIVIRKALEYASIARGKLEIRENEVEEINRKSNALYQLVKHLQKSDVRVDAVGFQAHLITGRDYDWESIKKNIRRFKKLGIEVYLTELDVGVGNKRWQEGDSFPEDYEARQGYRYYGIVKAAREAGVDRIDFWGLSDAPKNDWLDGQKVRLFDGEFKPRKSYQAVLKALYDTQQ